MFSHGTTHSVISRSSAGAGAAPSVPNDPTAMINADNAGMLFLIVHLTLDLPPCSRVRGASRHGPGALVAERRLSILL